MSDFITDVERQYELYCKIAEEHGFIDLNAKKSGFRCTTKSNEFNAGWIAFVGAVAAVRDEQQAIIDDLKAWLNNMEACYIQVKKERDELQKTNISLGAGLRKNSKNKQKLLGKNIELQKRIDGALSRIDESKTLVDDPYDIVCDVEKALRGEHE